MHYRACFNELGVRRKLRAAEDLNGRTVKCTDGVQGTSTVVTIGRVEINWQQHVLESQRGEGGGKQTGGNVTASCCSNRMVVDLRFAEESMFST